MARQTSSFTLRASIADGSRGQYALDLLDEAIEPDRIVNGHFRQRFAVEFQLRLGKTVNKFAVAHAPFANGRVDANDPKLSKIALPQAAMGRGVGAGANECFGRGAEQLATTADETFYLLEQPLLGSVTRDGALVVRMDGSLFLESTRSVLNF